ncbi:hypothetical protein AB1F87_000396 [Vibrio mimicus]
MILIAKKGVKYFCNSKFMFVLVCLSEHVEDLEKMYSLEAIDKENAKQLINEGYTITFSSSSAHTTKSLFLNALLDKTNDLSS